MKRYFVVAAILAVVLDLYLMGGTSNPTPVTFFIGLVYSSTLVMPPVAIWFAIDYLRGRR